MISSVLHSCNPIPSPLSLQELCGHNNILTDVHFQQPQLSNLNNCILLITQTSILEMKPLLINYILANQDIWIVQRAIMTSHECLWIHRPCLKVYSRHIRTHLLYHCHSRIQTAVSYGIYSTLKKQFNKSKHRPASPSEQFSSNKAMFKVATVLIVPWFRKTQKTPGIAELEGKKAEVVVQCVVLSPTYNALQQQLINTKLCILPWKNKKSHVHS